jgi:hypothetical protein
MASQLDLAPARVNAARRGVAFRELLVELEATAVQ